MGEQVNQGGVIFTLADDQRRRFLRFPAHLGRIPFL
jgi:hypothetical protein